MILVTGSTGLVGSHLLLYLLEKGEKVRALYRNEKTIIKVIELFESYNKKNLYHLIEWVQGDVTDITSLEVAFRQIDYVYHCASYMSSDPKQENILRKVNIEGTANIVNISIDNKIKKLCYVSSIVALGDVLNPESVITEKTEWIADKPHSDYAITKHGAEIEIWRGQEEGLNVIIINPGIIIESNFRKKNTGKIFAIFSNGLKYYTKGSSGFVTVTDVVTIMFKLMKSKIKGEQFIIVGKNIVFRDIIETAARTLKIKVPAIYVKPWMTEIAWKTDWLLSKITGRKRTLSKIISKSFHTKNTYSNEKIIKALNYNFTDIMEFISNARTSSFKK